MQPSNIAFSTCSGVQVLQLARSAGTMQPCQSAAAGRRASAMGLLVCKCAVLQGTAHTSLVFNRVLQRSSSLAAMEKAESNCPWPVHIVAHGSAFVSKYTFIAALHLAARCIGVSPSRSLTSKTARSGPSFWFGARSEGRGSPDAACMLSSQERQLSASLSLPLRTAQCKRLRPADTPVQCILTSQWERGGGSVSMRHACWTCDTPDMHTRCVVLSHLLHLFLA